jgi:single-strand DNA-binding protein
MSDTITIVGFVGTDPERRSHNGLTITSFRVGSPQRRFDRSKGEWVDMGTSWFTVSAYRGLAEHAFDSIHKRDRVILTGRLRVRHWESGESRGTAVDIDLDAIGHDLLWGTSVFTRDEKSATSPATPTSDAWAPAEPVDAGWANPGVEQGRHETPSGEDAGSAASGEIEDRARPLALAGAETPF